MNALDVCLLVYLSTAFIEGTPSLLLANQRDVQIIDTNSDPYSDPQIVLNSVSSIGVDFHYDKGEVFVGDIDIHRVWLNKSRDDVTIVTELNSMKSVAFDWITENLYVVDASKKRVEVVNTEGTYRKVLIWQSLDKPRFLALDPNQGWMFLTDWGKVPKIERCGMDGNPATRSVIVQNRLRWPNGITIDYDQSTIYWTDAGMHKIESADYDGSNRRTILRTNLPHPFSITVYNQRLYWTDWRLRSIESCNKISGQNRKSVARNKYSPMDVRVFSPQRQPRSTNATHVCEVNNGGCSHFCLISPISPFYICACPAGIRLLEDGKTCADEWNEFVLVASGTEIRVVPLDTEDVIDINLPIKGIEHVTSIAYDSVDKEIYWTDNALGTIKTSWLDGIGVEDVINTNLMYPEGIAIDWIAGNLYWTDTGLGSIDVARLDGYSRTTLIDENLDEPGAITLDPINGYMFWTDRGREPRIERANMDGTDRIVIVNTSLAWPSGIAVDYINRKIYWGDGYRYKIEESNFDGTDRRTLFSGELVEERNIRIFGLSLSGDYIYWTDHLTSTLDRLNIKTGDHEKLMKGGDQMFGVYAVKRYGLEGTNDCAIWNGGCSHLCLVKPGQSICACPIDQVLDRSGKNCISLYNIRRRG